MPVKTRSQDAHTSAILTLTDQTCVRTHNACSRPQNVPDRHGVLDHPDDPPKYLSLPPSERYVQLATDFRPLLSSIAGLFVACYQPGLPISLVRFLVHLVLRKVYSTEETAELRGRRNIQGCRHSFTSLLRSIYFWIC